MEQLLKLNHVTHYRYERATLLSPQLIRLHPAPHNKTKILAYALNCMPKSHFIHWQQDPFGNQIARVTFESAITEFQVEVDMQIKIYPINAFDFFIDEQAYHYPFEYSPAMYHQLQPFLQNEETSTSFSNWLKKVDITSQRTIDFLVSINQLHQQAITYQKRLEPGIQSVTETLEKRSGACRDIAWLLIQSLRHLGFAARYTSGYLLQLVKQNDSLEKDNIHEDSCDLHAWVEVFIPGAGWIGLDPTSGLLAAEGHIPLCSTPDPASSAPISGKITSCNNSFDVEMTLTRLDKPMLMSQPLDNIQWQQVEASAKTITKRLNKLDVRLTIGGEPTFTHQYHSQDPQWSTEALGKEKFSLAQSMIQDIKKHFAPGGIIQLTQGKHCSGESTPRWLFNCYWRQDKKPLWYNNKLLAKEYTKNITTENAKNFITTLSHYLQLPFANIYPAYETSINHHQSPLSLQEGALQPPSPQQTVGFVLPLSWDFQEAQWENPCWQFQQQHLYLVEGDTPIGYRLPINDIKKSCLHRPDNYAQPDLFEDLPPLADPHQLTAALHHTNNIDKKLPPSNLCSAVCISFQGKKLSLFIPPLFMTEHYITLIHCIEKTAEKCQLPVFLQGYPPPEDPRLMKCSLTPDPGVLEVNLHPHHDWESLQTTLCYLYELAYQHHLSAEKYNQQGIPLGSGGGNHIVLGSKTPADSPFLRKPTLLRSLITYWQHHPSLSYLFCGQFVGPTSQAPRIDEARHESLYELEIALSQLSQHYQENSYWKVDRLLRNLLVDMTGNTHRCEICIDKLYSPDHNNGRLGLVELRGFEMPPHPQLNLLQHLLVQGLLLRFWVSPVKAKFIRWGTALHDQYLLPHYIWQDFQSIISELQQYDVNFTLAWFKPFLAFRFPKIGETQIGEFTLQLHQAAEPWPVLGEQVNNNTTSRPVDSATLRLQIKITGQFGDRYCLVCNGIKVPLQKTQTANEYVAGIRFKAWNIINTLHPTLPIDSPLTFDILDLQNHCSIGGCRYYAEDPSGRVYDKPPSNRAEAKARLSNLFIPHHHSSQLTTAIELLPNQEYPHTLDLRKI